MQPPSCLPPPLTALLHPSWTLPRRLHPPPPPFPSHFPHACPPPCQLLCNPPFLANPLLLPSAQSLLSLTPSLSTLMSRPCPTLPCRCKPPPPPPPPRFWIPWLLLPLVPALTCFFHTPIASFHPCFPLLLWPPSSSLQAHAASLLAT